ncbi:hypothetical protein P3T76_008193 [Phytophthora citrophthora]|uniref:Uncharacterized protein n=1 Tax=Phytophthora citrophthora TaxID=4793 RepID=A0AAD9GK12_9STRA|nr:hypothetical protein P3T76_008193 [Phytophthora citrophthora]
MVTPALEHDVLTARSRGNRYLNCPGLDARLALKQLPTCDHRWRFRMKTSMATANATALGGQRSSSSDGGSAMMA